LKRDPLNHSLGGMRIAVCEAGPLTPDRDAGARAISDLIVSAQELGCDTRFFDESAGRLLERLEAFSPHVVFISRPGLFARLHARLGKFTGPMVFIAHDLHYVRLGLQRGFDTRLNPQAASVMRLVEGYCFRNADLSIMPTAHEAETVRIEFPGSAVTWMTYFAMPEEQRLTRPVEPRRLVFVGGSAHAPNRDGITWFVRSVWPVVQTPDGPFALSVCGAWDAAIVRELEGHGVTFNGALDEDELGNVMRRAAAGIAPMRFGAGMKRKTLDYLSRGLPVLSSSFGIEGLRTSPVLGGRVPGVIACSSVDDWVSGIRQVTGNFDLWNKLSREGHAYIGEAFSRAGQKAALHNILTSIGVSV
jgi:glycosyltransferase involved in cell wall biosynthesis